MIRVIADSCPEASVILYGQFILVLFKTEVQFEVK